MIYKPKAGVQKCDTCFAISMNSIEIYAGMSIIKLSEA